MRKNQLSKGDVILMAVGLAILATIFLVGRTSILLIILVGALVFYGAIRSYWRLGR